jgi:Mg-chelatase subunit ChlD
LIFLFFVVVQTLAYSQSLHVFSVSTDEYPKMSAKFITFDQLGRKVVPTQGSFSVVENGNQMGNVNITCPANTSKKAASIIFVVDISASMNSNFYNGRTMDKVKSAINSSLITLPSNTFEIAITAYSDKSRLVQDFTTDLSKIETAVNSLEPAGGTNYIEALIEKPSGLVHISKNAKYPVTVVFLTDGVAELPDTSLPAVLNPILAQNLKIHIVAFGLNAINALKKIADTTGGTVNSNILTENAFSSIIMDIFSDAFGEAPCIAEWTSILECKLKRQQVTFDWSNKSVTKEYLSTKTVEVPFNFTPDEVTLGFKGVGVVSDTIITLTAKDLPVNVTSVQSTNSMFTVTPTSFSLQPGESVDLLVSYTVPDSFYAFTELLFNTPCPSKFIVRGGFRDMINPNIKLRLIDPNGGQTFLAGSETIIRWDKVASTDTVTLHYSTNNGYNWHFITDEASNNEYLWKVPKITTDNCIVRVWLNDPFKKRRRTDSNDISLLLQTTNAELSTWSKDGSKIYYGTFRNNALQEIHVVDYEKKRVVDTIVLPLVSNFVRTIHRNPMNDLLAIGDSALIIFDPSNKAILKKFNSPKIWHFVQDVKWSPDGTKLAVVYISQYSLMSNIFALYDVASGQRLDMIEYLDVKKGRTRAVAWSKDGKKIAFSGFGSEISIYDVATKFIDPIIETNSGFNRMDLEWSNDGEHIITASGVSVDTYVDPRNILYNTSTGNVDASVSLNHFSNYATYHNDGQFLVIDSIASVIAYEDKTLRRVWQFHTPYTKYEVFDGFTSLDFSPAGDQLLGTINYTSNRLQNSLIVWEIQDTLLPRDVSDSVFRIVQPEMQYVSIDMREVLVSSSKDSIINPFVTNLSQFDDFVESIQIIGADSTCFAVLQGVPNNILPKNSPSPVEIQFTPNRIGVHSAFIKVHTSAQSFSIPITGIGVSPEIAMKSDLIDFGIIDVATSKDSLEIPTVTSQSPNPITIESITISGGDSANFEFIQPAPVGMLLSNFDPLTLDIRFNATEIRRFQSSLVIHHSGFFSPTYLTLFGEGGDTASAEVRIVIPQLEARTNSTLTVPVFVEYPPNTIFTANGEVQFNLVVNGTVLSPTIANQNSRYIDGKFVIPITLPLQPNAQGMIGTILLNVALGNSATSVLEIDSIQTRNSRIRAYKRDGLVTIIDICEEGGERLLETSSKIALSLLSQQPATDVVEVEMNVIENGNTKLTLVDLSGNSVRTIYKGSPDFTVSQIRFSTNNIANGTYFLVLKTPTEEIAIPIVVQK